MKNIIVAISILLFFYSCTNRTDQEKSVARQNYLDSLSCLCDNSITIQNPANIEGYTDKISYFPNDTVKIYISSKSKLLNINLVEQRLKSNKIVDIDATNGIVQNFNQCSFKEGCNWKVTNEIIIPKNVTSGYMTINLSNDSGDFKIPIIVKSKVKNDILCVASSNTWQAYNNWGGASFYRYDINDSCKNKSSAEVLSLERPIKIVGNLTYYGHLFDAELAALHWLEKQNYNFNVVTDTDLDLNPNLLKDYKLVILNTHSEYWTENALNGLDKYLDNKGSLCYLGANGLYWKVTLSDGKIECQKKSKIHESDSTMGGKWRNLGRFEENLIGVAYDRAGYRTFMPYVVINDEHWLFNGTDLKKGDLFGKSLNRKYASGHETDKITAKSPENTVVLARGVNQESIDQLGQPEANRNGGANMVFFENSSGGLVFSTGSITSSGSMLVDSSMSTIVDNFIQKAISNTNKK